MTQLAIFLGLLGIAGVVAAIRAADPRRCYRCRGAINPGEGLCGGCYESWRKGLKP